MSPRLSRSILRNRGNAESGEWHKHGKQGFPCNFVTKQGLRNEKFIDYAAHAVGEYWIIDPVGETIEKYVLKFGRYELSLKVRTGMIHSDMTAGFGIPVRAVFDEDENIAALRKLLSV